MYCITIAIVLYFGVYTQANLYSRMAPDLQGVKKLRILRKPGDCAGLAEYPNTFQCADTDQCLPLSALNDGVKDCCGPNGRSTCSDLSDENRKGIADSACISHPHYAINMTFQCAKNPSICVSKLTDVLNGRCDCCPEANGDCDKCDDHSDEECPVADLRTKFYCDGKCMAIELWKDGKQDCPVTCCEPDMKTECEKKKAKDATTSSQYLCSKYVEKGTPHWNCTSDNNCLPLDALRDDKRDCVGGEDESAALHPFCSSDEVKAHCNLNYSKCVKVNGGTSFYCYNQEARAIL